MMKDRILLSEVDEVIAGGPADHERVILCRIGKREGIIDVDGHVIVPFKYASINGFVWDESSRLLVINDEGLMGAVDIEGKEAIPCQYPFELLSEPFYFHEDRLPVLDEQFLRHIGALAMCNDDMKFYATAAGLLMFGHEYDIVREFPHYFLDYQEKLSTDTRWTHRMVSTSGDWSGNLYDFFFRVYPRITSDLPVPFIANGKDRIDETRLHLALREILLNSLVHADHYGRQGIVIIKTETNLSFSNPGDIRIGLNLALQGGVSDPRNETIMKMFSLVDIGERAGSGIPDFNNVWMNYVKLHPEYKVSDNPPRTNILVPYTIKALQEAGKLLIAEKEGQSSIKQVSDETPSIKSNAVDKSSIKSKIVDKSSIKPEIVDKMVDIVAYLVDHPHSSTDSIADIIDRSPSRTKEYLQQLSEIGLVVPEGANRNRTYSATI